MTGVKAKPSASCTRSESAGLVGSRAWPMTVAKALWSQPCNRHLTYGEAMRSGGSLPQTRQGGERRRSSRSKRRVSACTCLREQMLLLWQWPSRPPSCLTRPFLSPGTGMFGSDWRGREKQAWHLSPSPLSKICWPAKYPPGFSPLPVPGADSGPAACCELMVSWKVRGSALGWPQIST